MDFVNESTFVLLFRLERRSAEIQFIMNCLYRRYELVFRVGVAFYRGAVTRLRQS